MRRTAAGFAIAIGALSFAPSSVAHESLPVTVRSAITISMVRTHASHNGQVTASVAVSDATSTSTPDWACIRIHESGDSYTNHSNPGQTGAYSFLDSTWHSLGYRGEAWQYSASTQDAAALKLYAWGWRYFHEAFEQWSTRIFLLPGGRCIVAGRIVRLTP
jgi:hypothetical protein